MSDKIENGLFLWAELAFGKRGVHGAGVHVENVSYGATVSLQTVSKGQSRVVRVMGVDPDVADFKNNPPPARGIRSLPPWGLWWERFQFALNKELMGFLRFRSFLVHSFKLSIPRIS
jgi:pimeloyl-ACP methyl ester carboxylesterase